MWAFDVRQHQMRLLLLILFTWVVESRRTISYDFICTSMYYLLSELCNQCFTAATYPSVSYISPNACNQCLLDNLWLVKIRKSQIYRTIKSVRSFIWFISQMFVAFCSFLGTIVERVLATDLDTGINAKVR